MCFITIRICVLIITKVPITQIVVTRITRSTLKFSRRVWGIANTPRGTIDTICRSFCHFLVESHTSFVDVKLLFRVVKVKQTRQLNVVFATVVVLVAPNAYIS